MLTAEDKKWIKEYFHKAFHKAFYEEFPKAFNKAFRPAFQEAFAEVRMELRSDMAKFKDEILAVLRPLQEDHTVLVHHSAEHYDQLEDHEHRITTLERRRPGSPAVAVSDGGRIDYKVKKRP